MTLGDETDGIAYHLHQLVEKTWFKSRQRLASLMMTDSVLLLWFSAAPKLLNIILPLFLLTVAIWLWRRPEPVFTTSPEMPDG